MNAPATDAVAAFVAALSQPRSPFDGPTALSPALEGAALMMIAITVVLLVGIGAFFVLLVRRSARGSEPEHDLIAEVLESGEESVEQDNTARPPAGRGASREDQERAPWERESDWWKREAGD